MTFQEGEEQEIWKPRTDGWAIKIVTDFYLTSCTPKCMELAVSKTTAVLMGHGEPGKEIN
jgi:hypothetical protein